MKLEDVEFEKYIFYDCKIEYFVLWVIRLYKKWFWGRFDEEKSFCYLCAFIFNYFDFLLL